MVIVMAYLMPGNRGGNSLIFNGFRYQKNRHRKDKVYWRCWRKDCRAALTTNLFNIDENDPIINVLDVAEHDHPEDQDLILQSNIKRRMSDALADDPNRTVREVYNDIAENIDEGERDNIPAFDNVRSVLDRERRKRMPQIPASIQDVEIHGRWRSTLDGNRFLSKLDNEWGIAVFCSNNALRLFGECTDVYIDATFKSTPRPYKQFLTLHGFYRNRVVPFVFALMTERNVANYRQVFSHVKRRYANLTNNELAPTNIVSDFETGMMTAAHTEFPNSRTMGCFFHFCKSIWRRVQHVGLRRAFNRHPVLKRCIRKLMAIAYLPLALVRQNFGLFVRNPETRNLCRRFHALRDLIVYFERNYINGQFQPRMWNVHNRTMDNRTNNHVEGFNHRWNNTVGRKHPNLWFFINKVKREERRSALEMRAANRGDAPPPRRKKYRDLQTRISRLKDEYLTGNRNLNEYWEAMTYTVAQFH